MQPRRVPPPPLPLRTDTCIAVMSLLRSACRRPPLALILTVVLTATGPEPRERRFKLLPFAPRRMAPRGWEMIPQHQGWTLGESAVSGGVLMA